MNQRILRRIPLHRLMDLKVDFAFKQLFGSEKNKQILIVFLNSILKRTGRDIITDLSLKHTEITGEYEHDKESRLDILVKTKSNEWINVEMQFTNKYDMVKRTLYYWSKLYTAPLTKGMVYSELNPVITINILNFDLFPQIEHFHSTYHLYEDTEDTLLTNILEIHFIEIPKLILDWKADNLDPWNDILARWLLLLGSVDHRKGTVYEEIFKELEEIAMKDKHMFEVLDQWQEMSLSEDEYYAYLGRLKRIKDEEAVVIEAKLREEAARKRALTEGREEGRQEGIHEMIVNMIEKGFSDDMISDVAKRSIEEIQAIRKECE